MEKDFFVKLYNTRIVPGERKRFRSMVPMMIQTQIDGIERDIIGYKANNKHGQNDKDIAEAIRICSRLKEQRIEWLRS
jgi:hypothetical protein